MSHLNGRKLTTFDCAGAALTVAGLVVGLRLAVTDDGLGMPLMMAAAWVTYRLVARDGR